MKIFTVFLGFYFLVSGMEVNACSMCKVTINGRTWLGNNEDSWRLGSRIWFENGKGGTMGAVYVGYADNFPQGGMNEAGLAFDGLTTAPKPIRKDLTGKEILQPRDFVKEIMQTCRNIEDVRKFAVQFNRQKFFNHGEYLFADRSGRYLVMESDSLVIGNDDKYIIANFCPSITDEKQKMAFARYERGYQFIHHDAYQSGADYARALTDTMHECRPGIGDGTMYSFIADLEERNIDLYFYHDFREPLRFNLAAELAKGDHMLDMASMFRSNPEYSRFLKYKTPQNDNRVLRILFFAGLAFSITSFCFFISYLRKRKTDSTQSAVLKLMISFTGPALIWFFYILIRNQPFFYSPAPYRDYRFSELNIAAYIPFALLFCTGWLVVRFVPAIKNADLTLFSKLLLALHLIASTVVLGYFFYWGFYNIF